MDEITKTNWITNYPTWELYYYASWIFLNFISIIKLIYLTHIHSLALLLLVLLFCVMLLLLLLLFEIGKVYALKYMYTLYMELLLTLL
jgi:hypothetical protein